MPRLLEAPIYLTRDGIWPWIIAADVGNPWPAGAVAHTRFFNSAGAQVADINAAEVTADAIRFLAQPAAVADIPAGAKFETFIQTSDGPLKIRYGTVFRPEAKFFNTPPAVGVSIARLFTDSLQRTALGANWEVVAGATTLYDNSAQSLAVGMGANVSFFEGSPSAVRWQKQLSGDTQKVTFSIVMPTAWGGTNGKTAAVICADQLFTTGLALEVDSASNQLHMGHVTSPTAPLQYLGSPIANTPANNDSYTVLFNMLTNSLYIYKGASTTPLATWTDTSHIIAHGNGYRYTGFMFKPTFLATGPQPSGWAAKDDV